MSKSHKKTVKRSRKSIVKKSYRRVAGGYRSDAHKLPHISKKLSNSLKASRVTSRVTPRVNVEKVTPRIIDSFANPIYGSGRKPRIEHIIAHIPDTV
jgi:hypothetical protein